MQLFYTDNPTSGFFPRLWCCGENVVSSVRLGHRGNHVVSSEGLRCCGKFVVFSVWLWCCGNHVVSSVELC